MELDLTRLNSLAFSDFKRAQEKKQAPESPAETQTARVEYKTISEPKKPLETITEGLESIHKLQRQADAKDRIQRAIKAHEAKIADLETLIKRERIIA